MLRNNIKVWDDDGTWYSRYQYSVKEIMLKGIQGEKHNLQATVLNVYDTTKPRFSMIAEILYQLWLIKIIEL